MSIILYTLDLKLFTFWILPNPKIGFENERFHRLIGINFNQLVIFRVIPIQGYRKFLQYLKIRWS